MYAPYKFLQKLWENTPYIFLRREYYETEVVVTLLINESYVLTSQLDHICTYKVKHLIIIHTQLLVYRHHLS